MEAIRNCIKTIGKSFFNNLFERSIRVYIQKHLGEFLLGKLTTDQVDLGLDGGSLASLHLNAEAINEQLEGVNVPFTLVDGYIDTLHLQIPWSEISTESIVVIVDGLFLTIRLNETEVDEGLDVRSVFESMTASMVEEVMKSDVAAADIHKISEAGKGSSPFESVELMSEFISSITSRIQVKMKDIIIKTEKSPGVCVELLIQRLDYYDKDSSTSKEKRPSLPLTPPGFSTKILEITKVTLNLEEVWSRENSPKQLDPIEQSTMAFDIAMSSPPSSRNFMQSSIYPGMSIADSEEVEQSESGGQIPIISLDKTQTVTIQIKNDDQLPGPTMNISWNMESFHLFMSPKLLAMATKLLASDNNQKLKKVPEQIPMTNEDFEFCRRGMEEGMKLRDSGGLDVIDVPPLTMDRHIEMMHGGSADFILSEEDMFFSAYPSAYKSTYSVFDVSDSASVSTFEGSSGFSATTASAFSHAKKSKYSSERSMSRGWDVHTVETQKIDVIIPFFTVTVLLEDPEPCTVIASSACTPGAKSANSLSCSPAAKSASSLSCSPAAKSASSLSCSPSSRHAHNSGPTSLPASFSNIVSQFPQTARHMEAASSGASQAPSSFESSHAAEDEGDDEDDEDDEYHDSGDYFDGPVSSTSTEGATSKAASGQAVTGPHQSLPTSQTAKPKSSPASSDVVTNKLQEVAVKFFEAFAKLDNIRAPLQQQRDEVAAILALDHLGLIGKPVHVDISQEKKATETTHKVKVTLGKLELVECLFDRFSGASNFAKTALPKLPQYSERQASKNFVNKEPLKSYMCRSYITNNEHTEYESSIEQGKWDVKCGEISDICSCTTGAENSKPEIIQLLTFDVNSFTDTSNVFDPKVVFNVDRPRLPQSALSLTVDSIQKRRHHKEPPVVKLCLDFGKLTSEVDITIIDRLTNLINLDPSGGSATSVGTQLVDDAYGHVEEVMKDEQSGTRIHPSVQVKASHATLKVRFPIPDLREDQPSQAREWWRRNLHKEILILEMEAPEAMANIRPDEPLHMALQVFKISAYLQEDINTNPVLFGEVQAEDPKATAYDGHHFNWPRLVVCLSNKSNSALEAGEESDTSAHSIDTYLDSSLLKKESGPFSQKRSMYTRDDLSFSGQHTAPVNDEMVMPGNARELKHFREECMGRTSMSVEITAPCVLAYMHSRDFLELIYNRFNNDLLMWEPRPPRSRSYLSSLIPSSTDLNVMHMFRHRYGDFPSTIETEASESEDDESMLYSVHEQHGSPADRKRASPKLLNKMCFTLSIGRGKLLAVIPHVEQASNPDFHAELMITLKDGLLFSVNQHAGDPDLKYLCLQVNNVHMYHNGCAMLPVPVGTLDHIRDKVPQHLKSRICRSDRWVSDKVQGLAGYGVDSPDMLTLVVKTKLDTLNNLKNFTVAMRVDGATLRHEMHRSGESWISQAIDLLDLKDFPIQGYTLPKIMTELHLQIDHCGVDYRPLHLPVWSFLTVEHFSVCTNIIAESVFSQIRLQLDDTALFLANKSDKDKDRELRLCQDRDKEVNLFKDYVCVAEMDQFKIWLQFCYDKSMKQRCPKSDLRFKVNELNLRTCADSTRALQDLIQYICSDGDLMDGSDADDVTPTASDSDRQFFPSEDTEGRQPPSPVVHVPTITPEQEASVMSALEEAMTECPEPAKVTRKTKKTDSKMTKVYFQCNKENIDFEAQSHHQAPLHITVFEGSDSSTPDEEGQDSKDAEEFEIIDCHFKEITNIKGSHEVHMLTNGPIEVEENYIPKPTNSYDHLKAPDKFPDPEHQYTLREMSVVWHIYGGSDFSHPRRGSSSERPGFSKGLPSPREQRKLSETGGRHVWRRKGGDSRDHDVKLELDLNKIRFRYEVYAANTKQSSRFKLLVNNIELRDKVKASDINKFLVRLIDKENPEQTSAYMLMFAGVFIRPEHLPFREDCEVKAFCLPIQLNVDQNTLNFLRKFVTQVTESDRDVTSAGGSSGGRSSPQGGRASPLGGRGSPRSSLSNTEPIMRIGESSTKENSMDETELLMKFEDFSNLQSQYLQARLNEKDNPELPQEKLPVFIKSFVLISDVTIKLAYQGKGCDMDTGPVGLMLGLISLNGSVIKLKKLHLQKGLLGWNKLLMYMANEWLKDIRLNQIHSILKGFGSFSILCQIVQGLTDLVRLPIEQYQKDRRIIRGLQRGANSFTLNTIMAILELTNKLVGSIQYCAELGYDMLSPGPSVRRRKHLRHRTRQPRTTAEGAKAALQLVTEGVKESASHLSAIVSEESAHKGYVGIVGGTLRNATPECLFKPLAILAEAGTNIVQGARNEVDPSVMKEEEDRWKQA